MSEWLKEHAWKACVGETLPWVRIPLSPPNFAPLIWRSEPAWASCRDAPQRVASKTESHSCGSSVSRSARCYSARIHSFRLATALAAPAPNPNEGVHSHESVIFRQISLRSFGGASRLGRHAATCPGASRARPNPTRAAVASRVPLAAIRHESTPFGWLRLSPHLHRILERFAFRRRSLRPTPDRKAVENPQ